MTGNVDSGVHVLMRLLSTERLAHQVTNSAPSLNEDGSLQQDRHTPVTARCPTYRIRVVALSICSQGTTKGFNFVIAFADQPFKTFTEFLVPHVFGILLLSQTISCRTSSLCAADHTRPSRFFIFSRYIVCPDACLRFFSWGNSHLGYQ